MRIATPSAPCSRHAVGVYEHPEAFARLEAIGASLELGRTPHGPRWFRRYAAFCGEAPLADFIYLDARTLVLSDLTELIAAPRTCGFDVMFTDSEVGQVYEPGPLRTGFLRAGRGRGFNSGRWAGRRGQFALGRLERTAGPGAGAGPAERPQHGPGVPQLLLRRR